MCVVVLLMFNIYFDIDFKWNKVRIVLNLVNAFISKIRRWEIRRLCRLCKLFRYFSYCALMGLLL